MSSNEWKVFYCSKSNSKLKWLVPVYVFSAPLVWGAGCGNVPLSPTALCRRGGAVSAQPPGVWSLRNRAHAAGRWNTLQVRRLQTSWPDPFTSPPLRLSGSVSAGHHTPSGIMLCPPQAEFYGFTGSQLSERESPHWIWTCALCHRGWNFMCK